MSDSGFLGAVALCLTTIAAFQFGIRVGLVVLAIEAWMLAFASTLNDKEEK